MTKINQVLKKINIPDKLLLTVVELFALIFLSLLPFITIYIDLIILKNKIEEISVTEITQELFLFLILILFWYGSWKQKEMRGFLILVAGFFSTLFIREMDVFLDSIFHGFWFWIAAPFSLCVILYARYFAKNTTFEPLVNFTRSKPFFLLLTGLIIVLILSRTFGSGTLLWDHILPALYAVPVKTAIQEGLELFGYAFIFYGSFIYYSRNYS